MSIPCPDTTSVVHQTCGLAPLLPLIAFRQVVSSCLRTALSYRAILRFSSATVWKAPGSIEEKHLGCWSPSQEPILPTMASGSWPGVLPLPVVIQQLPFKYLLYLRQNIFPEPGSISVTYNTSSLSSMPSHGRGRMIKQLLHTFWVT